METFNFVVNLAILVKKCSSFGNIEYSNIWAIVLKIARRVTNIFRKQLNSCWDLEKTLY